MQYERFHPLLDKTAKDIREIMAKNRHFCDKVFGHHIKKVSPRNLLTRAALDLLSPCNSPDATMRTIVLSEAEWDDEGRRIFFPLPGLIESVYRANMNVRYEDFSLPAEAFAVAVPKGTAVGGIEIPAFLVSASTCEKNRRYAKKLSARIGIEVEPEPQPEGSVSICFNLRGTSKKLCFNSQRETIVSILGTGTATDGIEAVSSFVGEWTTSVGRGGKNPLRPAQDASASLRLHDLVPSIPQRGIPRTVLARRHKGQGPLDGGHTALRRIPRQPPRPLSHLALPQLPRQERRH